jgi:hypothetical protein
MLAGCVALPSVEPLGHQARADRREGEGERESRVSSIGRPPWKYTSTVAAMDNPRGFLIGGAIGIAVGVARLMLGTYVPLAVFLIVTGFVVMLIPLWPRVIDFFGLAWIALGVAQVIHGGKVAWAVISLALGVGWFVVVALINGRRRRAAEPVDHL